MAFVTLSKEEFKDWADETLVSAKGFKEWEFLKRGRELVIRASLVSKPSIEVHIFTTIEGDETRDIGKDAIRVTLYDSIANKGVESFDKVLRVTSQRSTVFERLEDRLTEALERSRSLTFCKKCGASEVRRVNSKTGAPFTGCFAFPKCGVKTPHYLESLDSVSRDAEVNYITSVYNKDMIKPSNLPVTIEDMTPLVEQEDCYPREVYPHFMYPFDKFNRVQSTILQNEYWNQDCNLVLGTSTSTGKTISGELFVWETLKVHEKKVCYVSPLKSLTMEKYNDWMASFGEEYKICILTGDFTLTEERAKELNEADMICLTSEMVDSRTRNHKSEKSDWIFEVGLVITDESHIISTERGHAVEVGLMRFCKLVPSARVLMLSATMPNVSEFKEWLTTLNGKETNVINNNWRPTVLQWEFIQYNSWLKYKEQQDEKKFKALQIVQSYPNDKTLVFVHDKNTGRQLEALFRSKGINCNFHNADLNLDKRVEVEDSFRSNDEDSLRVLISTSTLAWGVNSSAVNVVIVGVTRGLNYVDELDIIQMAGRAGRLGKSDIGRCFLICDSIDMWKQKVNSPRKITSTLLQTDILGFHILAEISNGEVYNKKTLMKWFSRSLASIQSSLEEELVNDVLQQLEDLGMLVIDDDDIFKITNLGRVSAVLYYYPRDVHHWAVKFTQLSKLDLWHSDLAVSYVLGTTPSWQLDYVPATEKEGVSRYTYYVKDKYPELCDARAVDSVIAYDLYNYITEQQGAGLYSRQIKVDIERITGALNWIDGLKKWHRRDELDMLELRVKYGVRAGIAEFCKLPGVGVTRARKLEAAGITSLAEVASNPDVVLATLGKSIGQKAVNSAKNFVRLSA